MSALAHQMAMIATTASAVGSVYTKALLHFDGASDSTSIIDTTGKSVWFVDKLATISSTQSKFGGSSLLLNGGYIHTGDASTPGTDNFCIEGFAYYASGSRGLFHSSPVGSANGIALGWNGSGKWEVYHKEAVLSVSATVPTGWFHFAVFRVSGVIYLAINGAVIGSVADASTLNDVITMYVGVYFTGSFAWTGYIDEFRITYGDGIYSPSGFTPPSIEFSWP